MTSYHANSIIMERRQEEKETYFEGVPLNEKQLQDKEKWPGSIQGVDENGRIFGLLAWHRQMTLEQIIEKRKQMKNPLGEVFRHLETLTSDANHKDIRFRVELVHQEIINLLPQEPITHLVPEPVQPELDKTPRPRRAAITSKRERSSRTPGKKVG